MRPYRVDAFDDVEKRATVPPAKRPESVLMSGIPLPEA